MNRYKEATKSTINALNNNYNWLGKVVGATTVLLWRPNIQIPAECFLE